MEVIQTISSANWPLVLWNQIWWDKPHFFSSVSFFSEQSFCHYIQFHLIKRQFIKWKHSICKLWYSKSQLFNENHWHSLEVLSQCLCEYWVFDAEYEYEYLCYQWSKYEYEYWVLKLGTLKYYEYEYQVLGPQPCLQITHKCSKFKHSVNQNTQSLTLTPTSFLKETCSYYFLLVWLLLQ